MVDEREARKALSVIAKQSQAQRDQFKKKLNLKLRGNSTGFIPTRDFSRALNEMFPMVN